MDILIDGFDNVKTINEKIISDDSRTFEERRKMLDDLKNLSNDSFGEQIKTIEQFTDKAVDANDLLATSDAKLLNEKIRSLGLSEIIEGRLLEIIRERRTATSDLAELEKQINDEQKEADLENAEKEKEARDKKHQDRLAGLELTLREEALMVEEDRINRLISEEEYQMQISELQRKYLEDRLADITAHYGAASNEARAAQADLTAFNQGEYKKDVDAHKAAQEKKKREAFQVFNAMSQAAAGFNQMAIDQERARLEGLKENLAEGQSLRKSEYNKLKKQQKTQVIISGITEVANIWQGAMSMGNPIVGAIIGALFTALAIARTAKNINAIESQKFGLGGRIKAVRRLAMGGMLRGPLHRDGGIPGVVKSTGQPIEMEDGEIILNRRVGLDPAGLAAASELNHRYGGVKFFQTGGPINPISSIASGSSSAASNNSQAGAEFARESLELQRQQIAETAALRSDVTSWQTNLKVNNNVNETREGINVINKLETDAAF